jgi:hypothetical protein
MKDTSAYDLLPEEEKLHWIKVILRSGQKLNKGFLKNEFGTDDVNKILRDDFKVEKPLSL